MKGLLDYRDYIDVPSCRRLKHAANHSKRNHNKKIDIPFETLLEVIESLSTADKKKLISKIGAASFMLKKFKKDKLSKIFTDFTETGLYESEFLADLEAGLKKSSVYR